MRRNDEQPERKTLDAATFAASLGVSVSAVYEAIQRGEIRAGRLGRRVLIPRSELDRVLNARRPGHAIYQGTRRSPQRP